MKGKLRFREHLSVEVHGVRSGAKKKYEDIFMVEASAY